MTCLRFAIIGFTAILAMETSAAAASIRTLPDLTNVTFWESTFDVTANTFTPQSVELLNRRLDPLADTNSDFFYLSGENYDVFYSNADGTPNAEGSFLTIEAVWDDVANFGGSMNITGVQLNFANGPSILADFVQSFMMGSTCPFGCIPGSEVAAVDGSLDYGSIPRFGGTDPTNPTERMRLTVGFTGISDVPTSPVPDPSSLLLLGTGIGASFRRLRRARSLAMPR